MPSNLRLTTLALASVLLAACSNGSPNSSSGTSPGPGAFAGTWDLTNARSATAAVLVLQQDALKVTAGTEEFSYASVSGALEVKYRKGSRTSAITTTRTSSLINLGALGLDLGGAWTFASTNEPSKKCTLDAQAASFVAACNENFNWPREFPEPDEDRVYTATRVKQLPSVFGDLGGEWTATDNVDKKGTCTFTFQDRTVSSVCTEAKELTGSMSLTFSDDGTATGTAGGGGAASLAGRKR